MLTATLAASNGKFICAEDGGGRELMANRDEARESETFVLIKANGGPLKDSDLVDIRTNGHHYLRPTPGTNRQLLMDGSPGDSTGTFRIKNLTRNGGEIRSGDKIALATPDFARFVRTDTARGGRLVADQVLPGEWEPFEITVNTVRRRCIGSSAPRVLSLPWSQSGQNFAMVVTDIDGNGRDEIVTSTGHIVELNGTQLRLRTVFPDRSLLDYRQLYAARLGGESIVCAQDDRMGVVSWHNKTLVSTYQSRGGWIRHPGGTGANGWHLGEYNARLVADVDGDGVDEVIVAGDRWMGTLYHGDTSGLIAGNITFDWVTRRDGEPNGGWKLGQDNAHLIGDIDGDGRAEIIVAGGIWMGVIFMDPYEAAKNDGRLFCGDVPSSWIHPPGSSTGGWALGPDTRRYLADFDGDGRHELILFTGNSTNYWAGIVYLEGETAYADGARLVAGNIPWKTIPYRNGSTGGWTMAPDQRCLVADVDGDGRAELVAVAPETLGIFYVQPDKNGKQGARLFARSTADRYVGDWKLRSSDHVCVGDFDGDGCDEILLMDAGLTWATIVRETNGGLIASPRQAVVDLFA